MNWRDGMRHAASVLVLFVLTFTFYHVGVKDGQHKESQKQVADYNDGWTDGQQDLKDQQWNAHFAGKPCK